MDIRKIQSALINAGFGPLAVDGVSGPATKLAIQRFQKAHGLVADGIVGPRTLSVLFPEPVDEPLSMAEMVLGRVTPPAIITGARVKTFSSKAMGTLVTAFDSMQAEFAAAGLTTPLRASHFMAQIATETGGLTKLEESLNYTAKRLTQVWPKRFPTIAAAAPFAHSPEALANKTYGGRLGNTQPGDGWRYRGSGCLQTTGRSNFRAAGHEDSPEALRTAGPALKSALQYWTSHNINAAADADDVRLVRKIIQGGSEGLDASKTWLAKARKIFV